jgi:hypothetical protein
LRAFRDDPVTYRYSVLFWSSALTSGQEENETDPTAIEYASSPYDRRDGMERITRKQKQIIHILEHQLVRKGLLDERSYHLLLMGWFGKGSSRDLAQEEASFLIDQLVKMGGVITWSPKHAKGGQRTPAHGFGEESSIEGLRHEVIKLARERYGENFERPLAALCRRFEIKDYRSMDVRHAKALKETLLRLEMEGPYTGKRKSLGRKTEKRG